MSPALLLGAVKQTRTGKKKSSLASRLYKPTVADRLAESEGAKKNGHLHVRLRVMEGVGSSYGNEDDSQFVPQKLQ